MDAEGSWVRVRPGPSRSDEGVSGKVTKAKGRRNKLSFVCQSCRRSKTRCDKVKPSCTRCVKNGSVCVYDVETQTKPKSRSKDSRIQQLQREIEYWKSKARGHTLHGRAADVGGTDPVIDFHHAFPMMIVEGQCKHEIRPSSALSYMGKDVYLFLFWSSASPQIGAEATRARIERAARASQTPNASRFLARLLHSKTRTSSRYTVGQFRAICMKYNFFEDTCRSETEYSELLLSVKQQFEAQLPAFPVIRAYLRYFYREVYPVVPFMDVSLFEEVLRELLLPDVSDESRVQVNFGVSDIRKKVVHLCLVACILGITRASIELAAAGGHNLNDPILVSHLRGQPSNQIFGLVGYVLCLLNLIHWVDEYTTLTHLYVYTYSLVTPELTTTEVTDPVDSSPLLICWFANVLGISKYPDDSELLRLKDSRVLSLRRKLWLGISLLCSYEQRIQEKRVQYTPFDVGSLAFSENDFPQARDAAVWTSLQRAYLNDPLEYNIQLTLYQKYKDYLVGSVLNLAYTKPSEVHVRLSDITQALEETRQMAHEILMLAKPTQQLHYVLEGLTDINVDFTKSYNSHKYQARILLLVTCVLTTSTLYLYFENQLMHTRDEEAARHYTVFFKDAIRDVLETTFFLSEYLEGKVNILGGSHFLICHIVENAMIRCFQVLFGVILRLYHAEEVLHKRLAAAFSAVGDLEDRLSMIRRLKTLAKQTLTVFHELVSKRLRWTLFSCLKRLITFDLALDMMKEEKVMELVNAPNIERLTHWGLDSDLEAMESINVVIKADQRYLSELHQIFVDLRVQDFISSHGPVT
ncbi:AaceriADR405Cp [[Ashbya] aceris (nom. inval.)]|nr:AaceriADR405Cp [[Ashbya] aceris (nom. inval.)]